MAETAIALSRKAGEFFGEHGFENGRLEAELLLSSVLDLSRLDLYLQFDRPLTPEELERFRALVRRRIRHEPIQYIVGEAHFRELVLAVDRRALIPRPETEVLVGEVLEWVGEKRSPVTLPEPHQRATEETPQERSDEEAPTGASVAAERRATGRSDAPTALDIGTGSGAIALSLVAEGPFERVVATDVSADALALAGENARRLELDQRVEFRQGALWEAVGEAERFDVVASNPPYVAEAARATLDPEVREWEPEQALFAPDGGMRLLDALVDGAPAHLRPGGLLALELGLGQADAVAERIAERDEYGAPRVVRDLAQRERFVLVTLAPSDTDEDG